MRQCLLGLFALCAIASAQTSMNVALKAGQLSSFALTDLLRISFQDTTMQVVAATTSDFSINNISALKFDYSTPTPVRHESTVAPARAIMHTLSWKRQSHGLVFTIAGSSMPVGNLRICSANGQTIRTLSVVKNGPVVWDCTNESGKKVALGCYLVRLELADGAIIGKTLFTR